MGKGYKPNKAVEQLQFEMAMDEIINNMANYIKMQDTFAKLHKARFDSLVKEGFTEQQALLIVAKRPIEE